MNKRISYYSSVCFCEINDFILIYQIDYVYICIYKTDNYDIIANGICGALDTYRHFVKAAEACGVSQSTLSTLVRKLEDEFDTVIFNRDAHPLAPTPAGEKLIAQARVILYNVDQFKEMNLTEKRSFSGEIKMAVIPTVSPYIVPKLFKRLQEGSPDIHTHIFEMQTPEILTKLSRAELDMAIMTTPLEQENLLEVPLYYEKLVMYVSPGEPLSKKTKIVSHDIPSDHLWILKEGHCFRNQVLNLCEKESSYKSDFEAGSINTLVNIVDENGGYTVIPEHMIDSRLKKFAIKL